MNNLDKNNFFSRLMIRGIKRNFANPLHCLKRNSVSTVGGCTQPAVGYGISLNRKEKITIRIKSFDFFYIKKIIEKLNQNLLYINKRFPLFNSKKRDASIAKGKIGATNLLKRNLSSCQNLSLKKPYNLIIIPLKIEKFTVERSPHIDKKSREQFQRTTYSCILSIKIKNFLQQSAIIMVCKQIKKTGVFIEIESKFFDFF